MAKMTPEQTTAFLALPNIAHFVTLRADGSPHSVPVWYGFAEGRYYVFTPATSLKMRNLARDPRMTLSIASSDKPYAYVVASGSAEIVSGDITDRAVSIASRYEGPAGGVAYIEKLRERFDVALIAMTPTRSVEWATNS
jgi:PPOX class probable F420-dependent enzyme